MKYCTECGTVLHENAKYCSICGSKFNSTKSRNINNSILELVACDENDAHANQQGSFYWKGKIVKIGSRFAQSTCGLDSHVSSEETEIIDIISNTKVNLHITDTPDSKSFYWKGQIVSASENDTVRQRKKPRSNHSATANNHLPEEGTMKLRYLDTPLLGKLEQAQKDWELICEKAEKNAGTFSVVVIGQQNNGKSTLCNALLQDWSNRRFAVRDVRQTDDIQEVCDAVSGITFVDTPGFGTLWASDATRAQNEWLRANLLLFVHSVRSGELDAEEVKMLQSLQSIMPQLEQRLFVVCSKFGEEEDDRVREVSAAVRRQITDVVSPDVPVEAIDSLYYQQGKSADDAGLVRFSHMDALLQWIDDHRNVPSPHMEIMEKHKKSYMELLKKAKKNILTGKSEYISKKDTYTGELKNCWIGSKDAIRRSWDNCSEYK